MKKESEFKNELKKVLFDKASSIFKELGIRRAGQDHAWTRKYREERIQKLLSIAEKILLVKAKEKLDRYRHSRKLKKICGPKQERGDQIYGWAKDNFPRGPILYAFWKKERCIYVGIGESYNRISNYKKSKYLDRSEANSLEVWSVSGKSYLHLVECLASHIYHPKENILKPKKSKYSKTCFICQAKKNIHRSLHSLLS